MSSSSSKGRKKNKELFDGKKNIVTAELYDDLQDKIDQVKKVVRNRSKIDIALVLRSCEQAENVVDAAIAKLIGPDGGKECLKEWATQSKKTKLKCQQGDSKSQKSGVASKHGYRQNTMQEQSIDTASSILEPRDQSDGVIVCVSTVATKNWVDKTPSDEPAKNKTEDVGELERKSRPRERRSRHYKKKPRPPKRIREKLKQLAPPEQRNESLFEVSQTPPIKPILSANKSSIELLEDSIDTSSESVRRQSTQLDSTCTSGIESGTSSISSTGTTSPSLDNSPVRKQSNDVFGKMSDTNAISNSLQEQLFTPPISVPSPVIITPSSAESSLRKLLKDLHRCDVSLARYQNSLNEQCDLAIRNLKKVFTILRIGLNTREEDIFNELQSIRQSTGQILQRRKATCTSLRKLSELTNHLEESQIQELKKQLKLFITERNIDEELGLTRRFSADPDDLLPSIMKFGKTTNTQASYNAWNEYPGEAVGKSSLKFSSPLPLETPKMPPLIKNIPPMLLPTPPITMPFIPGFNLPYPIPPHAILKAQSVFSKIQILPIIPPVPKVDQPSPSMTKELTEEPVIEYVDDEFGRRRKYSPEQLIKIQERVKESLQAQGVCLYNPYTGKAMKSESPASKLESEKLPVKKTPTQQRRERKKRQKERERRQREMAEKNSQLKSKNELNLITEGKTDEDIASIQNKVGKPATATIIKGYKPPPPWWNRKYYQYPYKKITIHKSRLNNTDKKNGELSKKSSENSTEKEQKKQDNGTETVNISKSTT